MSNFAPPDRKKVHKRKRKRKKYCIDDYVYVGGTRKLPNPQISAEIKVTININLN